MNRYLLLILLSSWSHVVPLSLQCETAVAYADHALSVHRSSMANADVAVIKIYTAKDVNACLKECCTEKYGACTVASFNKNASEDNCEHFNCRPVIKCKFLSSNLIDSFSFSSSSLPQSNVPSNHTSKSISSSSTTAAVTTGIPKVITKAHNTLEHGVTKESVDTYSVEQFALKNDNTTIKPRKGVDDALIDSVESVTRSGIKPRKGVSFDDVVVSHSTKSKVKPRKGVEPYQSYSSSVSPIHEEPSVHVASSVTKSEHSNASAPSVKIYKDIISNDLVSALEKVFEDDTRDLKPSVSSSVTITVATTTTTTTSFMESSKTNAVITATPTVIPSAVQTSIIPYISSSMEHTSSSDLQSSLTTSYIASSSVQTPGLQTTLIQATGIVTHNPMPSSSSPRILEHSKLLFHEIVVEHSTISEDDSESEEESENERKYKSSMHLVLSLVFGLLVLFSVLGVIAKRIYDSWMRRHYRRMDFLIDGMYNGFG